MEDLYDLMGHDNRGALLDIILDAVQLVTDRQLTALTQAGLTYFRLEPQLPQSLSRMDDISAANIKGLQNCAENYLKSPGADNFNDILAVINANK